MSLRITDLAASLGELKILKGIDLEVPFGEVHALMGPNGSGKSTLSHVLTGRDEYDVSGSASIDGDDLLHRSVDERARLGLFHGFQYPVKVPGVRLREFMSVAGEELELSDEVVDDRIESASQRMGMDRFLDRSLNHDLSGGEKKRSEIFQVEVLQPRVAVLDEIDSGLDIDAVRQVAEAVESLRGKDRAILMITHYNRIFRYITPDRVHVIIDGRIVDSGGPELADNLEKGGYRRLREQLGIEAVPASAPDVPKASEQLTDTPFDE